MKAAISLIVSVSDLTTSTGLTVEVAEGFVFNLGKKF